MSYVKSKTVKIREQTRKFVTNCSKKKLKIFSKKNRSVRGELDIR